MGPGGFTDLSSCGHPAVVVTQRLGTGTWHVTGDATVHHPAEQEATTQTDLKD
jgi:hypothetical protein